MDSSVWKDEPDLPDILPSVVPSLPNTLDDTFYKESPNFSNDPQADDLLMDQLKLHSASAKLSSTVITQHDLAKDDAIYKSSTITTNGDIPLLSDSAAMVSTINDEKIFDFNQFSDPKSFIRYSYRDIPKFLKLIFDTVNSETSSNNKNPLVPAIIVFQMLRYSYFKKKNLRLSNNFFELFINRIYMIIEDDSKGNNTPMVVNKEHFDNNNNNNNNNYDDNDDSQEFVGNSSSSPNTPNLNGKQQSKRQLLQSKVRKKNDIVLIAYWISVINHLYYYLLRQEGFFTKNPLFLKKIVTVLQDLINEFLAGITNRLVDLLDDCVIDYSSIPNLQKGLLFQNDWNFFKRDNSGGVGGGSGNTFQEILDTLYPPNLKQQLQPSPMKFLQVLEAIIYVFKLYNISSILLKNLLSRVLSWIHGSVFNRILANRNKRGKNYLTRTFAIQLRLNLSVIEDWVRSISKNLQQEDIELNPDGKTNEEYYLDDDELKMIIRDYPDDLIDFKFDLSNISRFDTNVRFYNKEEEEKKKKKKIEEEEEKKKKKKIEEEEEKKKKKKNDGNPGNIETPNDEKNKDIPTPNDEKNKDIPTPNDLQIHNDQVLKNIDPTPMINLDEDDEDNSYRTAKIDISSTPLPFISNFYYGSINKIFKYHFQVLYNLLEFLQVGTTYVDALVRSIEDKKLSPKQTEDSINTAFIEFLDQDIIFLNHKQVHYIVKNYKYEVDEPHFGKKITKCLANLGKRVNLGQLSTNRYLKSINYLSPAATTRNRIYGVGVLSIDDDLVYLNLLAGRDFPICLPTRQELISKYGAGMRGNNRETLVANQPYLTIEVRDMVDSIRDQHDYGNFANSEDDEDDEDDEYFNDGDDDNMTRPRMMRDNDRDLDLDAATGMYHSSIFGAAAAGAEKRNNTMFDNNNNNNDDDGFGMTRPESSVAKTWELNGHATKAKSKDKIEHEEIEYNPW
ncbi:hypothetical protein DASC09_029900 [Saccharomycopsis crataegensis]|uniref:Dilute domain-containing protein n=1 Tax=Saccharomycopsis crataegensis TaxID=43959 RepID=A0AAV5QL32_9ASCO|nr:hypothetical protein DASC09_029900 [Saccharomycopsis crataegensis]